MPKQVTFDTIRVLALTLIPDPNIPGRVNARADFIVSSQQGIIYQGAENIDQAVLGPQAMALLTAITKVLEEKYVQ